MENCKILTWRHLAQHSSNEEMKNRLLKKRIINLKTGCWEWVGTKIKQGYGHISWNGKQTRVHRLSAYLWMNFDFNKNLEICHKCDNPACFNPEHLFVGTHKDNAKDMINKNRQARGEKIANSKLTEKDIVEIRDLYKSNLFFQKEIAEIYNVSLILIKKIINFKIWQHVKGD